MCDDHSCGWVCVAVDCAVALGSAWLDSALPQQGKEMLSLAQFLVLAEFACYSPAGTFSPGCFAAWCCCMRVTGCVLRWIAVAVGSKGSQQHGLTAYYGGRSGRSHVQFLVLAAFPSSSSPVYSVLMPCGHWTHAVCWARYLSTHQPTSFPAAATCMQEGALTALASVADCAQEQFVRYYDAVMPLLSQILHNAQNKEHRWARLRRLLCCNEVHSPAVWHTFSVRCCSAMHDKCVQRLHCVKLHEAEGHALRRLSSCSASFLCRTAAHHSDIRPSLAPD
jgi:hypothetical protein